MQINEIQIVLLLSFIGILLLVLLIFVCVKRYSSNKETMKYYEAAGQMLKEEYLNYSLKNPYLQPKHPSMQNPRKIMLYIKLAKTKEKDGFVFDPKDAVVFGRQKEKVSICVNEAAVSSQHCMVYLGGDAVLAEDMGSRNGTGLIRKRKEYALSYGSPVVLMDKDILHIGSKYFQIRIFYYDTVL